MAPMLFVSFKPRFRLWSANCATAKTVKIESDNLIMKTCLTCGASVADDADVCPDCGMEFESAPAPMPNAPGALDANVAGDAGSAAPNEGAGFTVDFSAPGDHNSGAAFELDDMDFDFSQPATPVVLEKSAPTPAPVAAPVAANTAHITLRRGGALTSDSFRFGSGAVVGRFDPDSGPVDVDLAPLPEASYVSRHHAEFRHDAGTGQWFVRDMGSSNGTFWRAQGAGAFARLSGEQELNAGDEISLGNARFEFGVD